MTENKPIKECESIADQLYARDEEEEVVEPPMIFGNILIPMEDWKMTKEALAEEFMCDNSRAYRILNRIFEIALEHAEEDRE